MSVGAEHVFQDFRGFRVSNEDRMIKFRPSTFPGSQTFGREVTKLPVVKHRCREKEAVKVLVEYYFGASNDIVWIVMLEIHGTDDLRAEKKPPAAVVTWRLDPLSVTLRLRCFAISIISDYSKSDLPRGILQS
ncbi:hypothetical protein PTI98_008156 [Pleurotus ostreatus]|nr:hypothetical protein PTI98_008156 [Pleurotus ostreatus]